MRLFGFAQLDGNIKPRGASGWDVERGAGWTDVRYVLLPTAGLCRR